MYPPVILNPIQVDDKIQLLVTSYEYEEIKYALYAISRKREHARIAQTRKREAAKAAKELTEHKPLTMVIMKSEE